MNVHCAHRIHARRYLMTKPINVRFIRTSCFLCDRRVHIAPHLPRCRSNITYGSRRPLNISQRALTAAGRKFAEYQYVKALPI